MKDKIESRKKRKVRIRKKISGTAQKPRLSVFRSNRYFSLQAIDDIVGQTLVSVHGVEKEIKGKLKGNSMEAAKDLARLLAERAKAKGITSMVFDRNGYMYQGRVKQIAESLREHGIKL